MNKFDWQDQLNKRRKRAKYERIAVLLIIVFSLGFILWRFFYANTPEYALEKLVHGIQEHNTEEIEQYTDLTAITNSAYDDLTRGIFAADHNLSTDTKVMFEQFYMKIKPQVIEGTTPLLLSYAADGTWSRPAAAGILKGRQLGIDYEYLIERSQLRNTSLVNIAGIDRTDDTALAKVLVKDDYTETTFVLNLLMNKTEEGWKITKIVNYRDYLDFLAPIQSSGLKAYAKATQDIVDKYNDIIDAQQTNWGRMTKTETGKLSEAQRNKAADYITEDIIPALQKRQQELDAIPIIDGGQYLAKLRSEETRLSLLQWQHVLTGIKDNSLTELNIGQALHKNAMEVQHRIDDVLKNTAVNKMEKVMP